MDKEARKKGALRGWLGLAAGLGGVWMMAYVILPWGQTLPLIRPVMEAIADSDVDTGVYWYSQCERTVDAERHVRNALRRNR